VWWLSTKPLADFIDRVDVKSAFGISVYCKEYTFPILLYRAAFLNLSGVTDPPPQNYVVLFVKHNRLTKIYNHTNIIIN
jgi:hypothetical protein